MTLVNSTHSRPNSRLRDFILYIAIALAFGGLAVVFGRSSISEKEANQWMSLIFFSAILYGTFIGLNRNLLRNRSFWIVTTAAFTIHSVFFISVATCVEQWRPIWSAVMFFEAPLLDFMKAKCVHSRRTHAR
jgi:hypothetical protein